MSNYYAPPNPSLTKTLDKYPPLIPLAPISPPPSVIPSPNTHLLGGSETVPGFLRTSHMVPAASPRSLTPHVTLRQKARHGLPVDPGMLAKDLINAKLAFETDEMQKLYKETSDTVFWNCVDRYVRQCPSIHAHKPGVTLVLTHSLGSLRQVWAVIRTR